MRNTIPLILLMLGCASGPDSNTSDFRPIGHRGAAGHAPENTQAALQVARKMGVKEVELDVQLTKDREVVLYHDKSLNKKTKLSGAVPEHTLDALKKTTLDDWFRAAFPKAQPTSESSIISLKDAFKIHGNHFYYHIEIKSHEPELPMLTLKVIDEVQLQNSVQLSSFDFDQLLRVKELRPKMKLTYLVRGPDFQSEINRAHQAGFAEVGVAAKDINSELVVQAKSLGLAIRGWGVKKRADLESLKALKVYGSTLDYPDWVQ